MRPPEERERSEEQALRSGEELARREALLREAVRVQEQWESGPRKTTRLRIAIALVWLVVLVLAGAFFARRILMPSAIPPPTGNPTVNPTDNAKGGSPQADEESPALKELFNSFAPIPAGEFMMGSENGRPDEKPVHRVRISQAFGMGKYEVTQAQWEAVMGDNPSDFGGANRPVENVSWNDAQVFIGKLNASDGRYVYRLPTEAEWEYACSAGSNGDDAGKPGMVAWYDGNAEAMTHPVGRKQPNAWGLCDMRGNVFEWCEDWYDSDYYARSPGVDPHGPESGMFRVKRGGSWGAPASFLRATARDMFSPNYRFDYVGFRLARTPR